MNRFLATRAATTCALAGLVFFLVLFNIYLALRNPEFQADFRIAYYAAGQAVLHGGPPALRPLLGQALFVNLPAVSYLFVPFALLGELPAAFVFFVLGLLAVLIVFRALARGCTPRERLLMAGLFLSNGPLWFSVVVMGNTTHFVLLALVWALALMRRDRMYLVGALIGLSAVIKPMIAFFVVYFIVKRNTRAVLSSLAVIGAFVASSVAIFGMDMMRAWYQDCIVASSVRPIALSVNQSLNAFFQRLWTGTQYVGDWRGHEMAPILGILCKLSALGLLGLVVWAGWRWRLSLRDGPADRRDATDIFDFSLLIAFCVMTSPVSWSHYYLLLLLPWSFHLSGRLPLYGGRATEWLVRGSMICASLPVYYPFRFLSGTVGAVTVRSAASLCLFGGLLLLLALFRGSRRPATLPAPEEAARNIPPDDTVALV